MTILLHSIAVEDITELLQLAAQGDKAREAELYSRVYRELHRIASAVLWATTPGRSPDGMLQPTALVNEAYLRLFGQRELSWASRVHFFNAAALSMRRILLDAARTRSRAKRDGKLLRVDLDESILMVQENPEQLIAIDEALQQLQQMQPRAAEVVNLRFFLGFTIDETADLLQVSPKTVKRDWEFSRAWLENHLREHPK